MEIRIKQEELEHLAQLVFLGNFVINGIRMPEDRIKAYDDIAERIYCKQYNAMLKIAECEAEENEIADIRDWLYDSVSQYLSAFEGEVFLEKLGERIADINYPADKLDFEAQMLNLSAGEHYIKILKEKGASFVHMEAPKIDEQIRDSEEN